MSAQILKLNHSHYDFLMDKSVINTMPYIADDY